MDESTKEPKLDAGRILDNLIEFETLLGDGSNGELERLPLLEISKHIWIRKPEARPHPSAEI